MRKRRIMLLIGVVVAVASISWLVMFLSPAREPEYEGKKLSEWVMKLVKTTPDEKSQAEQAIVEIGTNAVPYLLKWIRYEPLPQKRRFYTAVNSRLARVSPDWIITESKELLASRAVIAFRVLGRQAQGAVPELTRIANGTSAERSARRAAFALRFLGQGAFRPPPPSTDLRSMIPYLTECLSSPDQGLRQSATNILREIDPQALQKATH